MISDEERREVARKLRERTKKPMGKSMQRMFTETLGIYAHHISWMNPDKATNRWDVIVSYLADLIEPQPIDGNMADDNAKAAIDEDMCGSLKVGGSAPSIAQGRMVVRRLTPMECERLQGFPDNWTKVPYRGKPAEECPDGPRYKAIGNSFAVPVVRWIGERIAMADKEGE